MRAIPGNEAVGFGRGWKIAHDVDAGCAGQAGRADVQRDEDGAALRVRHCGAVVKARIFVALARLNDREAILFERDFYLRGEIEI